MIDINSMLPLWSFIILLTIDNPKPVPFFFVVKYGLTISFILDFKFSNPIPVSIIVRFI